MARYKHIDTSPRFLAVDLQRQLLPGTFEHALSRNPKPSPLGEGRSYKSPVGFIVSIKRLEETVRNAKYALQLRDEVTDIMSGHFQSPAVIHICRF